MRQLVHSQPLSSGPLQVHQLRSVIINKDQQGDFTRAPELRILRDISTLCIRVTFQLGVYKAIRSVDFSAQREYRPAVPSNG